MILQLLLVALWVQQLALVPATPSVKASVVQIGAKAVQPQAGMSALSSTVKLLQCLIPSCLSLLQKGWVQEICKLNMPRHSMLARG